VPVVELKVQSCEDEQHQQGASSGIEAQAFSDVTIQESNNTSLQTASRAVEMQEIPARTGQKMFFEPFGHIVFLFAKVQFFFRRLIISKKKRLTLQLI
jgi:hypothetical protein